MSKKALTDAEIALLPREEYGDLVKAIQDPLERERVRRVRSRAQRHKRREENIEAERERARRWYAENRSKKALAKLRAERGEDSS